MFVIKKGEGERMPPKLFKKLYLLATVTVVLRNRQTCGQGDGYTLTISKKQKKYNRRERREPYGLVCKEYHHNSDFSWRKNILTIEMVT